MPGTRFIFSLPLVALPWAWFLLETLVPSPGAAPEVQLFRAAGISALFALVLAFYTTESVRGSRPALAAAITGALLGVALLPIPAARLALTLG